MKEVKYLYKENYKSMKALEDGKTTMVMDLHNQYCENDYTTKSNLYCQCNPHQNSNDILH
jgi:hypothetical protein